MAKILSETASASHRPPVVDEHSITLLRRLIVEVEDSIAQSREVILSTRDAIELLEQAAFG
jgi:hypothetical protein